MEFFVFSFEVRDLTHCGLRGRRTRDPLVLLFPHFSLWKLEAQDSAAFYGGRKGKRREEG